MKNIFLALSASLLLSMSAKAMTAIGVGIQGAQSNCNIETQGNGVISNCSFNQNGTVICDCEVGTPQGLTCNTSIGVGIEGAQSNCNIQTNGAGSVSNCSFNPNGTVVCSCCQ